MTFDVMIWISCITLLNTSIHYNCLTNPLSKCTVQPVYLDRCEGSVITDCHIRFAANLVNPLKHYFKCSKNPVWIFVLDH